MNLFRRIHYAFARVAACSLVQTARAILPS